ncbi:tyrosine-protein kinase Wzc [Serratia fonticola]|uniref:tyrosine-protein kinase Wzc n=1 Tax=Serratia fonticola TaxID=47917 RepID=UPI003AAC8EAB
MSEVKRENYSPNNTNGDEVDLGRLWGALIDHKWLLIGVTAFFATLGICYSLFAVPVYRADALIQIEQKTGNSLLNDLSSMLPDSKPASQAEIELLQSRMVLGKTIEELNLDTEIKEVYFPIFGRGLARMMHNDLQSIAVSRLKIPNAMLDKPLMLKVVDAENYILTYDGDVLVKGRVGQTAKSEQTSILVSEIQAKPGTEFEIKQKQLLTVVNDILDNLSIADKGKDTGVLSLTLTGDDPARIRKVLDSISNNYVLQNVQRKSEEAERSLLFLNVQLPDVSEKLNAAEDKLNQFRQLNDSVDLSLEAKSVLDTTVAVESQLNEITFKEAEISKLYTKEHPAYRALLEKRKTLELEREKLNRRVGTMPKTQQEILRLTRDVQSGQEIYMQLLNKQQELNISKASTVGNVRIIDKAITQPQPVKPQKLVIIILMTFLGMIVSICFVLLKSLLRKGIESPDQLEERGISVYASIPISEWQQKKDIMLQKKSGNHSKNTKSNALLAVGNPADLAIEAIRSLRTSLHFAMLESKNNVIMITGASPGIGKTFVSANLAAVVAQSGSKVLLIDSDMRKGYMHEIAGVKNEAGLSDLLSGRSEITNVITNTAVEGMDFISRGVIPPNPSELLMHQNFDKLIEWASKKYDLVIIDTPPILAVTDAGIIGRHVGTSLMVTMFEKTTIKEVEVSIKRFEHTGVDIKGVILNAVIKRAAAYYGYGYYNYSYKND